MKAGIIFVVLGLAMIAPGAVTWGGGFRAPEPCEEEEPVVEFLLPPCDPSDEPAASVFPARHPVQAGGMVLGACTVVAGVLTVARSRRT